MSHGGLLELVLYEVAISGCLEGSDVSFASRVYAFLNQTDV